MKTDPSLPRSVLAGLACGLGAYYFVHRNAGPREQVKPATEVGATQGRLLAATSGRTVAGPPEAGEGPNGKIDRMLEELAAAGPAPANLALGSRLLRLRAETDPAGTMKSAKLLGESGLPVSYIAALEGWSHKDPASALEWILQHSAELKDASPAEVRGLAGSVVDGRAVDYLGARVANYLSANELVKTWNWGADKWLDPVQRAEIARELLEGTNSRMMLRSYTASLARSSVPGLVNWLETLPIETGERAGLIDLALRTTAANASTVITFDSLKSENFVSLAPDDALAAVASGYFGKDTAAALRFASAIQAESRKAEVLATGALSESVKANGDPGPWIAALAWPAGDERYLGVYRLMIQQMRGSGAGVESLQRAVDSAQKVTDAQRAELRLAAAVNNR